MIGNFELSQTFIKKEIRKLNKETGVIEIIKSENAIDAYLGSSVKLDSKLLALFINLSKYSKKKDYKRVQTRNHYLAKRLNCTINGVQKAIKRLEELGLIFRTFYDGRMRNIHLKLENINVYANILDIKNDPEYNKKTPDSKNKKVKHGGYSRIDITRRRIIKDFCFFNDNILKAKELKRKFLERLKRINKRGKYIIDDEALTEYRDLNIKEKELKNNGFQIWDNNILNCEDEKAVLIYSSRWRI